MRHCITCNASFHRDDVRRCPDCGSRLLTDEEKALWHEAQEELTNRSFVPAHVLEGPVDEAFLTEIFSDAGIPWIVRGHRSDGFMTTFRAQKGWGVLLVPEGDLRRARELVEAYLASAVESDGEEFEEAGPGEEGPGEEAD